MSERFAIHHEWEDLRLSVALAEGGELVRVQIEDEREVLAIPMEIDAASARRLAYALLALAEEVAQ
jgi:hypothetical protein